MRKARRRGWSCTPLALALVGLVWAGPAFANQQVIQQPLPGKAIPKFVDPVPSPARIEATEVTGIMREFQQKVLPESVYPDSGPWAEGTTVWGFQIGDVLSYPGPTFEQRRFVPTLVDWVNELIGPFKYVNSESEGDDQGAPVLQKYLTVDQSLHWADVNELMCMFESFECPKPGQPGPRDPCCKPYGYPDWPGFPVPFGALPNEGEPVPAIVHLHGAENPPAFDGHPEAWFTPNGIHGPGYVSLQPAQPNAALFRYPNSQEASTYWYHDHTLGMTRLGMVAGLAGFYLLRDERDTGEPDNPIRLPAGPFERELMLQDRMFDTKGQLFFPDVGEVPKVHPFWRPEFLGDVIVVNGKSWPFLEVEPRRYRLRFLNASNTRFYELWISDKQTNPAIKPLLPFWQIGTDGGLLDRPVKVDVLVLGVAERADVIVDFAKFAGKTLYLRNTARAPFPGGSRPDTDTTGQIMQFRVKKAKVEDETCNPADMKGDNVCRLREKPIVRLEEMDERRQLVLVEVEPPQGGLELLLNNTKWIGLKESTLKKDPEPIPDSERFFDFWVTELPQVGATEVWEVANLTDDAHPIHLHLIQFQILNRQRFNGGTLSTKFYDTHPGDGPPKPYETRNADQAIGGNPPFSKSLVGPPIPPAPNENGWKDTVIMPPGQITRIIARWAPQDLPVDAVQPGDNHFPFDPTLTDPEEFDFAGNPGGPGYVWHCHILDHEDNEMMRPYEVQWERQVDPPPGGFTKKVPGLP